MLTHKESCNLVVSYDSQNICIATSLPIFLIPLIKIDIPPEWDAVKRDLIRQMQLHLHRFSLTEITTQSLRDEAERIFKKLVRLREEVPEELNKPMSSRVELSDTKLNLVDSHTARIIHQSYHYLGSSRGEGIHLGLCAGDRSNGKLGLLSIATLSPFDLMHLEGAFPHSIKPEQILVLSRLFAFEWSPNNTISYTLGRVFKWVREQKPLVKLIITYLDPNLGFKGTTYKATNWILLGREKKERYLFLDSDYVTDRQMIRLYGTADLTKLRLKLGNRISTSIRPLRPLEIYGYFLDATLRKENINFDAKDFAPDSTLVGANR